jgi:hypothetical protein
MFANLALVGPLSMLAAIAVDVLTRIAVEPGARFALFKRLAVAQEVAKERGQCLSVPVAAVGHGARLRARRVHCVRRIAARYCWSALQTAAPQREEPKTFSVLCQKTIARWFTGVVKEDQLSG